MGAALDWVAGVGCEGGQACGGWSSFNPMLARAAEIGIALDLFTIAAILLVFIGALRRRPVADRPVVLVSSAFLLLLGALQFSPAGSSGWAFVAKAAAAILGAIAAFLLWREAKSERPLRAEAASVARTGAKRVVDAGDRSTRREDLPGNDQRRLADEHSGALRRYEIALRGSHVTLYTQDRDLRFTSISNPLFGREVADIVGRSDSEVLPAESREQFGALVSATLATGRGQGGEVSVKEDDKTRWYDLHVEPLPGENGSIVGVTCALFDITDRKTNESHLRLLMRELTHRSKNLLAVIQSMARQTARHAGTVDDFLDAFGNRLQALATSHDLLVQEGWYGASLQDLTRRQLAKYLDGAAGRVSLSGPAVHLKPAAAQSFGLALHELAMNAERFGALSVPQGRVDITWRRLSPGEAQGKDGVEIVWTEHGGPDVTAPSSRGFGSLVVEKNLARSLDADVALTFAPTGVRCRMLIPGSHLLGPR